MHLTDVPVRHSGQAKREPESSLLSNQRSSSFSLRLLEPHAVYIGLILLGDPVRRVAGMNVHPVSETDGLPLLQRVAAILGLVIIEVVQAKRIHGKKSIAANVPVSRVAEAGWMVEDRHADVLAIDFGCVVDPVRRLSPTTLLALAACEFSM